MAAGIVTVVTLTALAAPDGSNVVMNEVYGGGNSGATYTHDEKLRVCPAPAGRRTHRRRLPAGGSNGDCGGRRYA
ncbi:hypothetical protein [Corynebacterium sp. HMSC29G08]|uniref:hypothetical protein n=1 Tax=Corynebacterium sp. HMSC29G08 TaxID=1581069 RepID=UPI00114C9781|nr:hypothetical protein [Corynebacterium sp. HMSC29G08]